MIHSAINSEVIISFLKYSSKSLEVIILHQVYFQNIIDSRFWNPETVIFSIYGKIYFLLYKRNWVREIAGALFSQKCPFLAISDATLIF